MSGSRLEFDIDPDPTFLDLRKSDITYMNLHCSAIGIKISHFYILVKLSECDSSYGFGSGLEIDMDPDPSFLDF